MGLLSDMLRDNRRQKLEREHRSDMARIDSLRSIAADKAQSDENRGWSLGQLLDLHGESLGGGKGGGKKIAAAMKPIFSRLLGIKDDAQQASTSSMLGMQLPAVGGPIAAATAPAAASGYDYDVPAAAPAAPVAAPAPAANSATSMNPLRLTPTPTAAPAAAVVAARPAPAAGAPPMSAPSDTDIPPSPSVLVGAVKGPSGGGKSDMSADTSSEGDSRDKNRSVLIARPATAAGIPNVEPTPAAAIPAPITAQPSAMLAAPPPPDVSRAAIPTPINTGESPFAAMPPSQVGARMTMPEAKAAALAAPGPIPTGAPRIPGVSADVAPGAPGTRPFYQTGHYAPAPFKFENYEQTATRELAEKARLLGQANEYTMDLERARNRLTTESARKDADFRYNDLLQKGFSKEQAAQAAYGLPREAALPNLQHRTMINEKGEVREVQVHPKTGEMFFPQFPGEKVSGNWRPYNAAADPNKQLPGDLGQYQRAYRSLFLDYTSPGSVPASDVAAANAFIQQKGIPLGLALQRGQIASDVAGGVGYGNPIPTSPASFGLVKGQNQQPVTGAGAGVGSTPIPGEGPNEGSGEGTSGLTPTVSSTGKPTGTSTAGVRLVTGNFGRLPAPGKAPAVTVTTAEGKPIFLSERDQDLVNRTKYAIMNNKIPTQGPAARGFNEGMKLLQAQTGMTPEQVQAAVKNNAVAFEQMKDIATRQSAFESVQKVLQGHTKLWLDVMNKNIPDTQIPIANQPVRNILSLVTGDTQIKKLQFALAAVEREYARMISGGVQSKGMPHVSANEDAQKLFRGMTVREAAAGAEQMKLEAENERSKLAEQYAEKSRELAAPLEKKQANIEADVAERQQEVKEQAWMKPPKANEPITPEKIKQFKDAYGSKERARAEAIRHGWNVQ
ncbi:MAG TPA: hypothetical protein VF077_09410 [Nitrospiraceae bacterium]